MKHSLLLILTFAAFCSYGQMAKKIDQRKGFKHFIFGTPKSSIKNININEFGGYNLNSAADTLSIGKFRLSECQLDFNNDKLSGISFTVYGTENIVGVLLSLKKAYGEVIKKETDDGEKYEWEGKYVYVVYHLNFKNPQGLLIFVDNAVRKANLQKKDPKNPIDIGADDL